MERATIVDPESELNLRLIPAPGDLSRNSFEFQQELQNFFQSLRKQGIRVFTRLSFHDAEGGGAFQVGEFVLKLAPTIGAVLVSAVGGWFHGRSGRKIKIKFGSSGQLKELEVQTSSEMQRAMEIVEKYRRQANDK